MGDADDTYNFAQLNEFVAKLHEGYDLVMGNRHPLLRNSAAVNYCHSPR
jgi:hypothetical protein